MATSVDRVARTPVPAARRTLAGPPARPLRALVYSSPRWANVAATTERLADLPAGTTIVVSAATVPLVSAIAQRLGLAIQPSPALLPELAQARGAGFYAAVRHADADFLLAFGSMWDKDQPGTSAIERITRRATALGVPWERISQAASPEHNSHRLVDRRGVVRCWVYALTDPRDGLPRYIGQTRMPRYRYDQHCTVAPHSSWTRSRGLHAWLEGLPMAPGFAVLEDTTALLAPYLEGCWILAGESAGWPLLNRNLRRVRYVSAGAMGMLGSPLVPWEPPGGR